MGVFSNTAYESDTGTVHPLRLRPETLSAAGAVPAAPINNSIRAKLSKSNNEFGLRPRFVRASRCIGTAPDQATVYTEVPVLTLEVFNSPAFQIGTGINVGGEDYIIISRIPEDVN